MDVEFLSSPQAMAYLGITLTVIRIMWQHNNYALAQFMKAFPRMYGRTR